jgi:hypothetical protein
MIRSITDCKNSSDLLELAAYHDELVIVMQAWLDKLKGCPQGSARWDAFLSDAADTVTVTAATKIVAAAGHDPVRVQRTLALSKKFAVRLRLRVVELRRNAAVWVPETTRPALRFLGN